MFGMVSRNRDHFDIADPERLTGFDFVQFDLGSTPVFVLSECVVEILTHDPERSRRRIDVDRMDRTGIVHEVESPHIVQTADMVFVFVGKQNRIEVTHARTEHLAAKIRPGVDYDPHAPGFDHRRSAQAVIARIGRSADLATAADHGHALRGTGS